jgi:hypothetical protein
LNCAELDDYAEVAIVERKLYGCLMIKKVWKICFEILAIFSLSNIAFIYAVNRYKLYKKTIWLNKTSVKYK